MNSVMNYIPKSPGRISMVALSERIGCTERDTRKYVSKARKTGEIIATDSQGYYLPDAAEELSRHYKMAYRRAISTLASLKHEREMLKDRHIQRKHHS